MAKNNVTCIRKYASTKWNYTRPTVLRMWQNENMQMKVKRIQKYMKPLQDPKYKNRIGFYVFYASNACIKLIIMLGYLCIVFHTLYRVTFHSIPFQWGAGLVQPHRSRPPVCLHCSSKKTRQLWRTITATQFSRF